MAGINATTLARIRNNSAGLKSTSTARDDIINELIREVSDRIERWTSRKLLTKERTDYHDVRPNQQEFFVPAFPISAVTMYYDPDRTYADALDSDDVVLSRFADSIRVDNYALSPGERFMKIVYTGGLGTSTNNITAVMVGGSGNYVVGEDLTVSTVRGTVVSWDLATLTLVWLPAVTVSNAYNGGVDVGDTMVGNGGASRDVASFSTSNLMYDYPMIAKAAEYQVINDLSTINFPGFDRVNIGDDSGFIPDADGMFIPKALRLLSKYKRSMIGL